VILLIVLFQSEIREVLEKVNPAKFFANRRSGSGARSIEAILDAAFELARENLGALMIIERQDRATRLMKEGVHLDGEVSREILTSIFQKKSPVHDGAAIIRGGRLSVVGSYLPLTDQEGLPQHFGTRHRAAIGLTERCDALGVVVSEETRSVSVVQGGKIEIYPDPTALKRALDQEMGIIEEREKKGIVRFLREWVTNSWKTKLIAFVIVILAWILFVGGQPVDIGLTAALKYRNIPKTLSTKEGTPEEVFIKVEGPRREIRNLKSRDVSVIIDLSEAKPGDNAIEISKGSVETPFGTRISLIRPSRITVTLEKAQ
jgi:diadenylate cyclase